MSGSALIFRWIPYVGKNKAMAICTAPGQFDGGLQQRNTRTGADVVIITLINFIAYADSD